VEAENDGGLKTKIRFNGQEYSSPAELPPDAHAAYEKAIAVRQTDVVTGNTTTRLIINGQEFSSVADMPVAEKNVYQDAMQLIRDEMSAVARQVPTPWLTKRQLQLIAIVAAFLIAAALLIATRM
jgi:hypothetical protein